MIQKMDLKGLQIFEEMANTRFKVGLFTILCLVTPSYSYKILLYPITMKSHYIYFGEIANGLLGNNHSVHMLVPAHTQVPSGLDTDLQILSYPVNRGQSFTSSAEMNRLIFNLLEKSQSKFLERMTSAFELHIGFYNDMNSDCEDLLKNKDMVNELAKQNFDLVVLDAANYVCPAALIYKLSIPLVAISLPWLQLRYRVPNFPSVFPKPIVDHTDEMTFLQRLKGVGHEIEETIFLNSTTVYIEKYVPEKPIKSSIEVLEEAVFWFYMYNPILLYPKANMPNTLDIGDITGRPGKPLPEEYQVLMDNAKDGVVLMSLGSILDYLPERWITKFCDAFNQVNSKVFILWKMKTTPECSLPTNVLVKSWVPQNDLLAHPNLKLFITHCGSASYSEAVYHAKPMIALPVSMDEPHNGLSMQVKGLGIKMDITDFAAEELAKNIHIVLENPSYTQAAQKLSERLRSKPISTKQQIVFWIEHVIQFGGGHLRSGAYKLSLYEYLMFDILGVFAATFIICAIFSFMFCLFCIRICRILNKKWLKKKTE